VKGADLARATFDRIAEQSLANACSNQAHIGKSVAQAIRDLHDTMKAHAAECGYAVTGHPDNCSCDAAAEEPK